VLSYAPCLLLNDGSLPHGTRCRSPATRGNVTKSANPRHVSLTSIPHELVSDMASDSILLAIAESLFAPSLLLLSDFQISLHRYVGACFLLSAVRLPSGTSVRSPFRHLHCLGSFCRGIGSSKLWFTKKGSIIVLRIPSFQQFDDVWQYKPPGYPFSI